MTCTSSTTNARTWNASRRMKPHNPAADIRSLEHRSRPTRQRAREPTVSAQRAQRPATHPTPTRTGRRTTERRTRRREPAAPTRPAPTHALDVARGQQAAYVQVRAQVRQRTRPTRPHRIRNRRPSRAPRDQLPRRPARVPRRSSAHTRTTATSVGDGTKPPAPSSSTDTNTTSPTNTSRSAKRTNTTTNNDTPANDSNKPAENSDEASAEKRPASRSSSSCSAGGVRPATSIGCE